MAQFSLATELADHATAAGKAEAPSRAAALAYCRQLARGHYENFTVTSWLLPRRLEPHFCAVYAFCRWADDLADETCDPARSLQLVDAWQDELARAYRGQSRH